MMPRPGPFQRLALLIGLAASAAQGTAAETPASTAERAARLQRGQEVYARNCFACHQLNGEGVAGAVPPLAKSDFLAADHERGLRAVCEGLAGEVTVNGRTYSGAMPAIAPVEAAPGMEPRAAQRAGPRLTGAESRPIQAG